MANRYFSFSLNNTDVVIAQKFRSRSTALINALADKMLFLMTKLQDKARRYQTMTAKDVPSERVQESIQNPSAEIQGGKIVGHLDWGNVPVQYMGGEVFDLAQIFEKGAKPHAINPLTDPITGKGTRRHDKPGAKTRFGTGAKVLRWEEGGKAVFRHYTFHPGLPATHFMSNAVADMREEFREQLMSVVYDALE